MASVEMTQDEILVRLSPREKLAGLHGNLRVPIAAVESVELEPDALAAVHGLRAPGLGLPGVVKIGTWRRRGSRSFVVARRGVPAVHLTLREGPHRELIVSVPDAGRLVDEVRSRSALGEA